jgi:hypothetical protein
MTPEPPTPPPTPEDPELELDPQPQRARFTEKLSAVLFCVFCLELGLFLLIYPWLDTLWNRNWLFHLKPEWSPFLLSQEFRGGVSGLGMLNLFVGFYEVIRLRRFVGR